MYTVKQLATLAGVTARTLRHYDQIGLLRPTRLGANGYRYYDEGAALRLQQIMLYRELDLPLEDIKRIMGRRDYDILAALEGHRRQLRQRAARLERLIQTVDETIVHLRGEKKMDDKQIFAGFTPEEEEQYAREAEMLYDAETVRASNRRWKSYSAEKKQQVLEEGRQVYLDLIAAIPLGPESPEAQACVARWRAHMDYFWTPSPDQLVALAEMYSVEPRFRANFEQMHPELAAFMGAAVRAYVARLQR